jgi:hypothetical protein
MRPFRVAVGVILTLAAIMAPAPVSAQSDTETVQDSNSSVLQLVNTTINNASLFQCPSLGCNQGVVVNGIIPPDGADPVSAICSLNFVIPPPVDTLVVNKVNLHVGFINHIYLTPSPAVPFCNVTGIARRTLIPKLSLFQCPNLGCNQGVVEEYFTLVRAICTLAFNTPPALGGHRWVLVYNPVNSHVGFVDQGYLDGPPTPVLC